MTDNAHNILNNKYNLKRYKQVRIIKRKLKQGIFKDKNKFVDVHIEHIMSYFNSQTVKDQYHQ